MKNSFKEVLAHWRWILSFSVFITVVQYCHLMFMSGVNPVISNVFVSLTYIIGIFLVLFVVAKIRKGNIFAVLSALAIALFLGFYLGHYIVFNLFF
jgi:hypothetical protein